MSASSSVLGVAVLLLHLWGTHSFPTSACPVPCLCQHGPLLNCSSLGLTEIPTHIPATAVSLNLSNNALRSLGSLSFGHVKLKGLLHLWVGSNALESLSLILKKDRSGTRTRSSREQECTSWAPDLQLLSAERNHLKHLPKGLGCMKSLQILQLSYNHISKIGLTDLDNCINLKELHLQHNSIISIHPHAFIDLKLLQVLDLSYNMLVTIPVPAYQSLRNTLVDVSFNRWKCDCNLQALRRWISFDTEMGDTSWQVVCASPPHHGGKDLLHLKDSELTCPTNEYSTSGRYHNMIVDEGMQISIPCSNDSQDIMQVRWWTPHGQVTDNQPKLLIKDITEQHAGLYICISGLQGEHISVFDLHVYKKGSGSRPRREAATMLDKQENMNTPRNDPVVRERSQSEFILAVCLSVIITFIVAFILGVLLRPLLDKLWRRIQSKRRSTPPPPPTASSTGPQPYVNEGYCDVEDQEREVRVGSTVSFGEITEVEDQVPYYVTVENDQADGSSESNTEGEGLYENIERKKYSIAGGKQQSLEMEDHRGRADSSSSSSLQEGEVNALVKNGEKLPPCSNEDMAKSMEFEPIPDAIDITQLKRRGSSSTSSQSSQEGSFSRETEENVGPPAVTIQANKSTMDRIPGFSTEPLSEWSTRLTEQNVNNLDPELWNNSGESFSFTDGSERSSIRDISSSALGHPLKDDETWRQNKVESPSDKINLDSEVLVFDKPFGKELPVDNELSDIESSSNSSESGESVGGPNNYVVNPELMDESDKGNYANLVTLNRFGTLEDVTLNERMPSADILIRQETVTLEPSDIHLTFPHGESVDESMHIYDSLRKSEDVNISDKFGICVDVDLDTVAKVKRYVEFKQFEPHSGPQTLPSFSLSSTKNNNTLSDMEVKSEANTDAFSEHNRSLTQIEVSPDRIQKVKRYIHFKHPEPHSPTLPSSPSFTKKDKLEAKSYSSSSDDDAQWTTKHANLEVSSYGVSKVKRYISFEQLESSSPTMSVSRPSTSATTTEEAIKPLQPSTTPKDSSQNVKKHVYFKQHKHHSSSLPSSPTSTRKGFSGKKTKRKKQHDQSYYGSHDSLPLYHVHPVYRSSINRLNRGYDTDTSCSSEEEDTFLEYPSKLEITIAPGINRGSIKPDKNTEKVLNIDFDNSSSSTDVFDKKHPKGLMRLRALSARLFNKHGNETDEGNLQSQIQTKSPTGSDVGRTGGVSINRQQKVTKVTTNEDSLFRKGLSLDHLPKVKRYLQFSHSDSNPQVQLPSPPPTTGVVTSEFIMTTESRRSSFSSEDDVKQTTEDKNFVGQVDASYDRIPKVKRYIKFSSTEPCSTTLPLNKQSISPELVAQPESRRSSTSSEDDTKLTTNENNFFRKIGVSPENIQKVKRYIHFKQSPPDSPTLPSSPSITMEDAIQEMRFSSSSDDDQLKTEEVGVSKVKRFITFKQFEPSSPTLSVSSPLTKIEATTEAVKSMLTSTSNDDVRSLNDSDNFFAKTDGLPKVKQYLKFKETELHPQHIQSTSSLSTSGVVKPGKVETEFSGEISFSLDRVPNVKRYIQFKQPVSHLQVVSPTTSDTLQVTTKVKTKSESKRSSTSSEDDVKETAKVDNVFGQTETSLDRIPRVKRYIQFTHPEIQSPAQTKTGLSSERVNVSMVAKETRRWSTSSEEDVRPKENITEETVEYLAKIPKVKRYIKFTQSEPYSLNLSSLLPLTTEKSMKVTETELKQPATRESTSSEDDVQEDDGSGQIEVSLNRVPRVKRYIQFTHPESKSPVQSTSAVSAQRLGILGVVQDTRKSSTSSEEDVTLTAKEDNVFGQTGASLDKIPKVKRYIQFTKPEREPFVQATTALSAKRLGPSGVFQETRKSGTSSADAVESSTHDDDVFKPKGASFDKIPKVKRYIKFTQSEPYSLNRSPFLPLTTEKSMKVTETELKQPATRESTSSEDDVQEDDGSGQIELSLNRVPRVKRYIQFTHPESKSPVQSTSAVSAQSIGILGVVQDTRKSSTSSGEDVTLTAKEDNVFGQTGASLDKIPKVKRYIQFTKPESEPFVQATTALSAKRLGISGVFQETRKSGTASDDGVESSTHDDDVFKQKAASFDKIPKVKRYIKFTQSEPSQGLAPFPLPSTVKSVKVTETGSIILAENEAQPFPKKNVKEDNVVGQTEAHLERIPRVKRYIRFTHQSPEQSTTSLSAERVGISEVILETRRSSTSSEDEVKLTANEDNYGRHIGAPLDKIPKVKRYIEFRQYEPCSSAESKLQSSSVVKSIKGTATELRGSSTSVEDYVQPATNGNKTESMAQITSSETLDRVPRVKRYIQFTPIKSQYPARAPTAVLDGVSGVAQETKILSTSSKYVKPSATNYNIIRKTDTNFSQETGVSLDKIPNVKRYIAFTKSEPPSSTNLIKRDLTPTTNTDLETTWSSLSTEASPPASMKNGSALIMKAESESWTSELTYKDDIIKGELMDSSVELTGLKSKLRKSSSSSSDEQSVGHEVVDVQDEPPAVPQTSPPPLEQEDAREYQLLQHRQLLQQRRREMDEFKIASLSSMQQGGDKQDRSSADYGGVTPFQTEHTYSSVSTRTTLTSRGTEGDKAPVLRGLKTQSTSTLSSKSPVNSTPKYREFFI